MQFSITTATFRISLEGSDEHIFKVARAALDRAEQECTKSGPKINVTQLIEAIRIVRSYANIGLKEAKKILDPLRGMNLSKGDFIHALIAAEIHAGTAVIIADQVMALEAKDETTKS